MEPAEFAAGIECRSSLPLSRKPALQQDLWEGNPTAEQLADPDDVFALAWRTHRAVSRLGLSEKTIKRYTDDGLLIIRHYDAGTDWYSDKALDILAGERRFQYEHRQISRVPYSGAGARDFL